MRSVSKRGASGLIQVNPLPFQHSSLITPLAQADCLLIRPPQAPPAAAGSIVSILSLDD